MNDNPHGQNPLTLMTEDSESSRIDLENEGDRCSEEVQEFIAQSLGKVNIVSLPTSTTTLSPTHTTPLDHFALPSVTIPNHITQNPTPYTINPPNSNLLFQPIHCSINLNSSEIIPSKTNDVPTSTTPITLTTPTHSPITLTSHTLSTSQNPVSSSQTMQSPITHKLES